MGRGGGILYEQLALVFRFYIIHGHVSNILMLSTLIPSVKDKLGNLCWSDDYRCIAIRSLVLKMQYKYTELGFLWLRVLFVQLWPKTEFAQICPNFWTEFLLCPKIFLIQWKFPENFESLAQHLLKIWTAEVWKNRFWDNCW